MDKKRCHEDTDDWTETKRLRANILDILEDDVVDSLDSGESDPNQSPDSNVDDELFTVMKSFEEEIALPPSASVSDSGDSQQGLGYLLEASDDELGLPPTFSEEIDNYSSLVSCEELLSLQENFNYNGNGGIAAGLGQIWGFDDDIPSFDLYSGFDEIGRKETEESFVFEGLFDYSNDVIGEESAFSWRRSDSLPALQ